MPRHKTKLISIHTLKPSHFRPPHKNQVNSDLYTEIKSKSITNKWNQVSFDNAYKNEVKIRCPHKNQVILGQHTKNQVNFDHPHKNEVNFDQ